MVKMKKSNFILCLDFEDYSVIASRIFSEVGKRERLFVVDPNRDTKDAFPPLWDLLLVSMQVWTDFEQLEVFDDLMTVFGATKVFSLCFHEILLLIFYAFLSIVKSKHGGETYR